MSHLQTIITTQKGGKAKASAPVIVSASRATDLPAFYADWFFRRIEEGYVRWRNPFNGKDSYVSFDQTRFIVFWSKNPAPLLSYLSRLKNRGIGCYIQFTLNDYEAEGLEPNIPPLTQRIDTFKRLVDKLGLGSVVWRFDPLILTDKISGHQLLDKITNIAEALKGYTETLVFSYADIGSYKKVGRNLSMFGINYREWNEEWMKLFASRLSALNQQHWNYCISTCAEAVDLSKFGIEHNRCIDPALISRLTTDDLELQNILSCTHTDNGQRSLCGCIEAKDIGAYNTCTHGCLYCYANTSPLAATRNQQLHFSNSLNDAIIR